MVILLLIYLCLHCHAQTTPTLLAIQNTQEVYFSYVPLIPCPIPDNTSIQPGSINYTLLNPTLIFQQLQLTISLTFWEVIKNGFAILINQKSLLMNGTYAQLVYYNSSVSDDFSSREFILTSFIETGNIVLHFANAIYNNLDNITLNIDRNVTTNFSSDFTKIVQQCLNLGKDLRVVYLGGEYFLGLCPNTTNLFSFNPFAQNQAFLYNLNNTSFQSITPDPSNVVPNHTASTLWNAALLTTGGTTATFCNFNLSSATCSDFQEGISWLQTIATRIWGIHQTFEQQQALIIMQILPQIYEFNFQGSILSVFRQQSTLYVQSVVDNQIYLAIFDGSTLLLNITLIGNILYYGAQQLIVQPTNGSLYLVSFTLPYLTISNNGSQQTSQTISFQCDGYEYNQTMDIFWTNIVYPTSTVLPLKDSNRVSERNYYSLNLNQEFEVIGPAFQIFAMNDDNITIALMSAPVVTVASRVTAIFQIQFLKKTLPQVSFLIYFLNKFGHFHSISSSGYSRRIACQPCGFTSIASGKLLGNQYLIKNTQNQLCLCQSKLKNCQAASPSLISSLLQKKQLSTLQRAQIIQMAHQTIQIYPSASNQLNQQLNALAIQGMIINIYADGQIDMVDLQGNFLANLQSNCSYNDTQGMIFVRNFYDNFFFVLCEGEATLTQYIIRNDSFIFNRVIPIWGFVIRPGGNWLSGVNYLFLQVDINQTYFGPFASQAFTSCCVLRIDPNEFTVSTIAEIVQANSIVLVQSLKGVDIVYYNQTSMIQGQGYLKIYFQSSWVSFEQNQKCHTPPCPPQVYEYNISFASLIYNFAASFNRTITFDTTKAAINAPTSPLPPITFRQLNFQQYNAVIQFNFTTVCGPISYYSLQFQNQSNSSFYQLDANLVSTKNKMLNQFDTTIVQLIDLDTLVPNSCFSNYIMIVLVTSISLYIKFDGVWLDQLLQINLPNNNCAFYLYSIQNDTSISFGSNCYNLDLPTPLLTLNYQNQTNITYSFATMLLPTQLRSIKSIPIQNNPPFIIGLGQGPSKSITGLLLYCQNYCSQLSINTKVGFVIDFDITYIQNQIVVVGLDLQSLNLWLNLPPPTQTSITVEANYTVNYSHILDQNCDLITLVNAFSLTQFNVLLSCGYSYFQLTVNFTNSQIIVLQTYQKYLNCDPVDKTHPTFTQLNNQINILIALCNQNFMTLRTQQFQTIDSSNSSIATSYLQIYVPQGPICNSVASPIRIIPLAVTSVLNSYLLYNSNGFQKLLYEQIDGLLIDSFIDQQPKANLSIIQLNKQQLFPQVSLKLSNIYYSVLFQINTSSMRTQPSIVVSYIVGSFFILTNLITLASLICWFVFKRKKRSKRFYTSQYQLRQINSNSSETSRQPDSHPTQQQQNTSTISTPINSPQIRRVTQIQLFQPRYKPT